MLMNEWLENWWDVGVKYVDKENKKIYEKVENLENKISEKVENLENKMNDISSKFDLILFLIKKDNF